MIEYSKLEIAKFDKHLIKYSVFVENSWNPHYEVKYRKNDRCNRYYSSGYFNQLHYYGWINNLDRWMCKLNKFF